MGKEIQICEIVVECYIFHVLSSIMQRAVNARHDFCFIPTHGRTINPHLPVSTMDGDVPSNSAMSFCASTLGVSGYQRWPSLWSRAQPWHPTNLMGRNVCGYK